MDGERAVVGLISDTHGLLRPEALDALRGVRQIVHAGDVGRPEVLDELARLAPLVAVRGNVDTEPPLLDLPETAELEVGGVWIHVRHILEQLDLDPRGAGFDVVVTGHSHRPSIEERGGVLWVNPGSAGPRRFKLPVTVALLTISDGEPRVELVALV